MEETRFDEITHRVEALQNQYASRDAAATAVRAVRHGDFDQIAPGIFPADWPRPICANIVDNMARDFAASLSPMPSFNCSGSSSLSEGAKKFADKRSKIANNYIEASNLAAQMPDAADSYNCYGMVAFSVEPNFEDKRPQIRVEDSMYIYPVWDRNMKTVEVAKVFFAYAQSLEADYPKVKVARQDHPGALIDGDRLKVVKYMSRKEVVTYLPECGNLILEEYANPLDECLMVCVPRPGGQGTYGGIIRGQYDDLVWPQLARNEFQVLALEAADKSVRAPIVIPTDVTDIAFGPDATIQTNNPQGVQRLKVDVPAASFQSMEWLRMDMERGGMSSSARSGETNASVITGAGMDALMMGYSTQLAQAQEMMRYALRQVVELCFDIDEKCWPSETKEVRGQDAGVPFTVKYTPSKDIAGDHTVDVQYGFLAGMDANRSLIFILQAYGAGLLSGDYAMRQLPASFNVSEEAKKIELEHMRKSLLDSLAAASQALPQMVAGGMDPSQLISMIAAVISGLKKGEAIEDVVAKVFAPPEAPPPAPELTAPAGPSPAEQAGLPGSEQAGAAPMPAAASGPPDLMTLMAGMTQGRPNLGANVRRTQAVA